MTIEKDEIREYVAALTAELATMSQRGGLPFLAYLLSLAQIEASGRATVIARNPRTQTPAAPVGQDGRAQH